MLFLVNIISYQCYYINILYSLYTASITDYFRIFIIMLTCIRVGRHIFCKYFSSFIYYAYL